MNLTQELLKEILSYDPATGIMRWIKPTKFNPWLLGKEGNYSETSHE